MKYFSPINFIVLVALQVIIFHTSAYSNELPQGINEFVHSYLGAAKQNDLEKLGELTHSTYIKCSAKSEKDNYAQVQEKQIKAFSRQDRIMKINYKAYSPEEINKMNQQLNEMNKKWSVEPEGVIVIIYVSYHKASRQFLTVARESNNWKWVHYCEKERQGITSGLPGEEEYF